MLVLSRTKDEAVDMIDAKTGELIGRILLVDIFNPWGRRTKGNKVRLGFEFPESIRIMRTELMEPAKEAT